MAEISITNWIEKAKQEPKQAAIPVMVLATLIFFGYKLFYSPKKIELVKQEKKNKSLQADMAKVQSASANKEEIALDIENKKKQFEQSTLLCYKKNEITSFLRHMRQLATKTGITVKSINPKPLIPIEIGAIKVEQLPVSFNFEGDLAKLGIFLRMIELEEKITFIKLPRLSANKNGIFNLNLEPTVIIVPDDFSLESVMAANDSNGEEEEEYDE